MNTDEHEWKELQKFCRTIGKDGTNDFARYLNEAWFSKSLAWLLNPKESHGFGVKFAKLFLIEIARERTKGCQPWQSKTSHEYVRRATMLKWRRSKYGLSPSGLSLKNAFPVTEFYLSKEPELKRNNKIPSYVDILFMDLDLGDSIIVAIENKLFTVNHDNQLEWYYNCLERKFSKTKVREYVYLTLLGDTPHARDSKDTNQWVCLSWLETILSILEELTAVGDIQPDIAKLIEILRWLKMCHPNTAPVGQIQSFRKMLQELTTSCLLEELNRLGEKKRGTWKIKSYRQRIGNTLVHSSYPARNLYVKLLPNLTITISGRDSTGCLFEKVIVPFGCNADQMFNLLDLAARDVYRLYFIHPALYLASKRRLRQLSKEKQSRKPFFDFTCEYSTALLILLQIASLRGGVTSEKLIKPDYPAAVGNHSELSS